jgi:pimeloyl-ACP methyl ester carboxylesterase
MADALRPALDAERMTIEGRSGPLSFYVAGDGPPLLLVHSINAAGSAYEVRPLFEAYRQRRRVYAPDLPGFGYSDRSRRDYTVRLYVDAIHDLLDRIRDDGGDEFGDPAVDALALSLSSEFLARAATERPRPPRSLALVTPTGFRRGSDDLRSPAGETRELPLLHAVLTLPPWRRAIYRALVSPRSIRYFLRRTWGSDEIDEGLAAYDDLTTHQPGAEHAPYAFLCGKLFSRDIRDVYERLELPVWLAHGTRGDFSDFSEAGWARERNNWRVEAFDSGALPHFEHTADFVARYDDFLGSVRQALEQA